MITVLGETESRELLKSHTLGRLGCCLENEPFVVPINYYFDGEAIYVHSLPGKKIGIMRENPRICLQVDEIRDPYNWRSVLVYGSYDEITEQETREQILSLLFHHLPHLTPVESKIRSSIAETVIFRILIDQITGITERW